MRRAMRNQTRRRFLTTGALGACATLAALRADAAEPTAAERANINTVTDFCAAWLTHDSNKVNAFLADNVAMRWSEKSPWTTGREASAQKIKQLIDGAEKVELQILDTYARGPMVLNERMDKTTKQGKTSSFHLVGIFIVRGGKIAEWLDYAIG
jgi:limonene-1,2-epoxide hydrolase